MLRNFTICILASIIAFSPVSNLAEGNIESSNTNLEQISMDYEKSSGTLKTNVPQYEVTNLTRNNFSINGNNLSINGKAPAGSDVTIKVYNTRTIHRNKYNLAKLPDSKDYILSSKQDLKSGNFGFYQSYISLTNGVNKVVVDFNREGVKPIEIIIYSYKTINRSNIM